MSPQSIEQAFQQAAPVFHPPQVQPAVAPGSTQEGPVLTMLSQPGVPGLPEIPGAQSGQTSLSIFDGDLTLAEISGKVRHLQSKIDDAATRDRAQLRVMAEAQEKRVQATALELAKQALHAIEQVRLQQLDQVDKARTMQQERARRDAEEGKRKIDEQMNQ